MVLKYISLAHFQYWKALKERTKQQRFKITLIFQCFLVFHASSKHTDRTAFPFLTIRHHLVILLGSRKFNKKTTTRIRSAINEQTAPGKHSQAPFCFSCQTANKQTNKQTKSHQYLASQIKSDERTLLHSHTKHTYVHIALPILFAK